MSWPAPAELGPGYTVDLASGIPSLPSEGSWPSWSSDNAMLTYVLSGGSRWVTIRNFVTGEEDRLANGVDPDWRR
jgi:hypothetical protein